MKLRRMNHLLHVFKHLLSFVFVAVQEPLREIGLIRGVLTTPCRETAKSEALRQSQQVSRGLWTIRRTPRKTQPD